MRELTLQKRLGHASLDSTRRYTRVSDKTVVAEYRHALGLGNVTPNVASQESATAMPTMPITQVFAQKQELEGDWKDKEREMTGVEDEISSSAEAVRGEREEREERRNK
jgi:hypothetical protein